MAIVLNVILMGLFLSCLEPPGIALHVSCLLSLYCICRVLLNSISRFLCFQMFEGMLIDLNYWVYVVTLVLGDNGNALSKICKIWFVHLCSAVKFLGNEKSVFERSIKAMRIAAQIQYDLISSCRAFFNNCIRNQTSNKTEDSKWSCKLGLVFNTVNVNCENVPFEDCGLPGTTCWDKHDFFYRQCMRVIVNWFCLAESSW